MPEWLSDSPQWLWWVGAALVFGIVEMTTLDLIFLMLALGALVAAVAAGVGIPVVAQVLVFAVAAGLFVVALRPAALRHLRVEGKGGVIGIQGNIGQTATVLEEVTDRSGLVKLRGEPWTARAELAGQRFAVGDLVTVVKIDGATAVVTARTPEDKPFDTEAPTEG
ncbi:NfeD family protein [Ornithinimicrobium tianjinense]|uniref:Membrane protein n=1 Tax=Ornithinimicrobium tianjinense TaxID=1195761 RepID=A0A917BSG8_9MICO|nr:NfeD family protein [Ornithinimicrobium tianjinense]GGF57094.1 membrane protein [Ornithinimicrobium tianjinense]